MGTLLGLQVLNPEKEGSTFLRNVCRLIPDFTEVRVRRSYSSNNISTTIAARLLSVKPCKIHTSFQWINVNDIVQPIYRHRVVTVLDPLAAADRVLHGKWSLVSQHEVVPMDLLLTYEFRLNNEIDSDFSNLTAEFLSFT
jgi:hypothetical protein